MRDKLILCLTGLKFQELDKDIELVDDGTDIIVKNFRFESEKVNICLPAGITMLGDGCFSGTNIEQISLCKSIVKVGYGCFANCSKLRKIIIHNSQLSLVPALSKSNSADVLIKRGIHHGDVV